MIRFDERDTMFSRMGLVPGSKRYKEYYDKFPEKKEKDDEARYIMKKTMAKAMGKDTKDIDKMMKIMPIINKISKVLPLKKNIMNETEMPMLKGSGNDKDIVISNVSNQIMKKASLLHKQASKEKIANHKVKLNKKQISKEIKELVSLLGIDIVGIAEITPEFNYSHRGSLMGMNGNYGEKINYNYKYAIVIASPLIKDYINRAPHTEELIATMRGYSETSSVASQVAMYIKSLGYDAITDDFLEYQSAVVPLAVKAGIGQLGRSNLLVNPTYGNRLKIGAVLTNIPLEVDKPIDFGLKEFCSLCGKCAKNCPSGAISKGEAIVGDGVTYWPHDEVKCMKMWMKTGTDCGICMSSCPFSQGIDEKLIEKIKGNKEVIKKILKEYDKKYGKRNYIKDKLTIVDL